MLSAFTHRNFSIKKRIEERFVARKREEKIQL